MYKPGSPVIYCLTKYSRQPGPRARDIYPAKHGDAYSYCVEKLWRVERLEEPNKVVVLTRRGKRRELTVDDPNLRTASWFDRIRYWGRFPQMNQTGSTKSSD